MSQEAKEIIFEQEARRKLASGISQLAEAVRPTLGPKGRNVGLEKSWGAPNVTNDGNSIVKEIELADQFENMGVAMAKEVAAKLKEKCGDGTTTGVVLMDALVAEGMKYIAAGASPIALKRGIDQMVSEVVKQIEKIAIDVKDHTATMNIATVSASGNTEIGRCIADAIEKVGREGVVTIEEAKGTETSIEMVEGMQFDRGYISPYFCTNSEKRLVEMEKPAILLVDKKISTIQELLPLLQSVAASGKSLLIIAEDIEADALATLVVNRLRGTLRVAAVKAPGFGDRRKSMLEDLAILTGGTVVSEETGGNLKDATPDVFGTAEHVLISKDNTTIVGGEGDVEAIDQRVAQLDTEIKAATSSYDQEKLQERKAKLKGGVAVIRVGAATEPELKAKKQAYEDSLSSTRAALEAGIIAGGGVALYHASQKAMESLKLHGDEEMGALLVRKSTEAPLRQIVSNAGQNGSVVLASLSDAKPSVGFNALTEEVGDLIEAGVMDPAKVVINALVHAASAAGIVLLSEALIGDAEEDESDA